MSDLMPATSSPDQFIRRSPLYRLHQNAGAKFETIDDAVTVARYSQSEDEKQYAQRLGLVDLSTLPRVGFKGAGAPAWALEQGLELPDAPNRARSQADGSLIARLSREEILMLSDLNMTTALISDLQRPEARADIERVYCLPRGDSHCWFAVTGAHAAEVFSKICAVDFRAEHFSAGAVAQTSLARVNAIIVRHDQGSTPGFYIFCDLSYAESLWFSLLDAMLEFEGKPVGMDALRGLAENRITE